MKRRWFAIIAVMIMLLSLIPMSSLASGKTKVPSGSTTCKHSWGKWVVSTPATCTEKGTRWRKCSKCGYTEDEVYGPLGHSWKVISETPGDCMHKGTVTERCTRCKKTRTRNTDFGDHNWGAWFLTPGRTGVRERDCSICGKQEFEYFPVLELKLEEKSTPADGAYIEGETVSLYATLKNIGEGDADNAVVTLDSSNQSLKTKIAYNDSDGAYFSHYITEYESKNSPASMQASAICDGAALVFSNVVEVPTKVDEPRLKVEISVDNLPEKGDGYFRKGEPIYYKIMVTNLSKYTVYNVVVSFKPEGGTESLFLTCSELEPNESGWNPRKYIVTQDDVDRKEAIGYAYATCDGHPDEVTDEAHAPCTEPKVSFTITKSLNDKCFPANDHWYTEGEIVKYDIEVVNTGADDITNLIITDPGCEEDPVATIPGPIAPNESVKVTARYKVRDNPDCQDGYHYNTAYASCDEHPEEIASNEVKIDCGYNKIDVEVGKQLESWPKDGGLYFKVGEKIKYRVTVKNTSIGETLSGLKVYDAMADKNPIGTASGPFAPGETMGTWVYEHTVTKGDIPWIVNQAYATISDTDTVFWSNSCDAMCGEDPVFKLSIVKSEVSKGSLNGIYQENDLVVYSVALTNTGTEPLYNIVVYDPLTNGGSPIETIPSLNPNETWFVKAPLTYTITASDMLPPYCVENYAWASFDYHTDDGIAGKDKAVSNTVYVYTKDVPPPPPTIDPIPGEACEVEYTADCEPILHYCSEHDKVHTEAEKLDTAAGQRDLWKQALEDEYDLYFDAGNGPGKEAVLAERMRFFAFLNAREKSLKTLHPDDPALVDDMIREILEQKVVLMCYEIHKAPAERTGFAPDVTGTSQATLMLRLTDLYNTFDEYAFRSDVCFFTAWLANRQPVLEALYQEDDVAVQKALEQEILDNIRRLNKAR